AALRDLLLPSEPVLRARRGGRAARRRQHPPLPARAARADEPDAVPRHHAQPQDDGGGRHPLWRHHGGARALEARLREPRRGRRCIGACSRAPGESPDGAPARYGAREGGAPPPPRPTAPAGTTPAAKGEPPSRSAVLVSFVLLVILGMALFAVALMTQPARED